MKRIFSFVLIISLLLTTTSFTFVSASEEVKVYDATVLPTTYQTVKGWGVYPNSVGTGWNGKYAAHKALYKDLGISQFRVEIRGNCGDAEGNLVKEFIDTLASNIQYGVDNGVNNYLVSIFTPPAGMKTNNKIEGINADGTRATLLKDKEEAFCKYIVSSINYLVSKNLPAPMAISLQNEPNNAFDYYQTCYYDLEQYKRVAKLLRKTLDDAGYKNMLMVGPESAQYSDSKMWLGENFSELENDKEYASVIDAFASHSYYNKTRTKKEDIDTYVKNTSKFPEKDKWQTEFSTAGQLPAVEEIDRAIEGLRVFTTDMAWVGNNVWYWWMGWDPRASYSIKATNQEAIIDGDGVTSVNKGIIYQVLAEIYNNAPVGSKVMRMSTNDPTVVNESTPQSDMVAFSNGSKMVVMLINTSKEDKTYNFHGLKGSSAKISSATLTSTGLEQIATRNMTSDTVSNVNIPARSINVIVTSLNDTSPPNIEYIKEAGIGVRADGVYVSRNSALKINGKVDEQAEIMFNGKKVVLNPDFSFSKDISITSGTNVIRIDAKDKHNNKSQPVFLKFEYNPKYVGIELDKLKDDVNTNEYIIKGRVNVPSSIQINADSLKSDEDLTFEHKVVLAQGENKFTLTATDEKGNVSKPVELVINCDSKLPEITVLNTNNVTEDSEFVISGKTDEIAKSLKINGIALKQAEDLSFLSKFPLKEGENTFNIQAEDFAKNIGTKEYKVILKKTDKTPHSTDAVSYTRKANKYVAIDGDLSDEDWVIDNKADKALFGDNPNNIVNFGTLWDKNYLYVGMQVYDDKQVFDDTKVYNNDCLEIFVNPSNRKEGKFTDKDKQLFVGYIKDKASMAMNTGADYKTAWKDIEGGYSAEIAIPWSSMDVNPVDGLQIGFDLVNDDKDAIGPRQYIIAWSGTTNNWQDTKGFGTLILTTNDDVTYKDKPSQVSEEVVDGANEEAPVGNTNDVKVVLNGNQLVYDVQPIIINDFTMVPIRVTANALGVEVVWNEASQEVQMSMGDKSVKVQVDNNEAWINDQKVSLQAPATLRNDRVLVPLRFISEAFGAKVDWDGANNTVIIAK